VKKEGEGGEEMVKCMYKFPKMLEKKKVTENGESASESREGVLLENLVGGNVL